MLDIDEIAARVIREIQNQNKDSYDSHDIPIGVSNRHIHLSAEHLEILFGRGARLTWLKDLSQPGQFACQESVTLIGPGGVIEKVRILGPVRKQTQVEILAGDCYKLGLQAPIRESGKLDGTPGLAVCGPKGCVQLVQGLIVAKRHLHMTLEDAERFGCRDGELVKVQCSGERGGVLNNVVVRVTKTSRLDFHLDMEEANCMGISGMDRVKIII